MGITLRGGPYPQPRIVASAIAHRLLRETKTIEREAFLDSLFEWMQKNNVIDIYIGTYHGQLHFDLEIRGLAPTYRKSFLD
jgi:hypothetical protein